MHSHRLLRGDLKRECESSIYESSPAGTAELSPRTLVLGWISKDDPACPGLPWVPQGRLKMGRDAILLQPSLRDSIMLHAVPRTIVLG